MDLRQALISHPLSLFSLLEYYIGIFLDNAGFYLFDTRLMGVSSAFLRGMKRA